MADETTNEDDGYETDEEWYVETLGQQRGLHVWCLVRYGNLSEEEARANAADLYAYEPPDPEGDRGVVFHDSAWHWAMLRIHGFCYWHHHPELLPSSEEYNAMCAMSYAMNVVDVEAGQSARIMGGEWYRIMSDARNAVDIEARQSAGILGGENTPNERDSRKQT